MKKDLVAVADLDVGVRRRCVPEHRPGERLKSHVTQGPSGHIIPAATRSTSLGVDRHRDRGLDPIQRIVGEERHVVARVGRHDLVPLCQNVDRARAVCHNLPDQPRLKRRNDPLVARVDHNDRGLSRIIFAFRDRLEKMWQTNVIRIVSSLGKLTPTAPPSIVAVAIATPTAAAMTVASTTTTVVVALALSRLSRLVISPRGHGSRPKPPGPREHLSLKKILPGSVGDSLRAKMATAIADIKGTDWHADLMQKCSPPIPDLPNR